MKNYLDQKHLDDLAKSGINAEYAFSHGFRSWSAFEVCKQLKWKQGSLSSGYFIPYPKKGGGYYEDFYRVRLDVPYVYKNKNEQQGAYSVKQREGKYLSPKGSKVRFYIPHPVWHVLDKIEIPLFFTEGEKKALKATQEGYMTIGLAGVWAFSSDKKAIQDFELINLNGRLSYIVFDGDKLGNANVLCAERRFAEQLLIRKSKVKIIDLPQEQKLDDFLVDKPNE